MYKYAYANFFFLPDMLILEYPIVKESVIATVLKIV